MSGFAADRSGCDGPKKSVIWINANYQKPVYWIGHYAVVRSDAVQAFRSRCLWKENQSLDVCLYDTPFDPLFYESVLKRKWIRSAEADAKLFAKTVRQSYLRDAPPDTFRIFEIPTFWELKARAVDWQDLDLGDLRLGEWLLTESELHYSKSILNGIGGYSESVLLLSPTLYECFAPLCDGVLFKSEVLKVSGNS